MYFNHTPITIRLANAHDEASIARLAELDSAPMPIGERMLLAELGGITRAAVSIDGDARIADPFVPTSDVLALLDRSAASLRSPRSDRRSRRTLRRRTGRAHVA